MRLSGLILAAAVAAVVTAPWLRDMRAHGLARRNFRDRGLVLPNCL